MKKLAILLCLFASMALGYTDFDTRAKNRLCELYREQELAKFYGQYRELDNIQKRIDNYKFRFGIDEDFDGSQCDFGRGYYFYDPRVIPAPPPPSYYDEQDRRYYNGRDRYYQDRRYRRDYDEERYYRRGY